MPNDVPGWFAPANEMMLSYLIPAQRVKTVLEIGTCYGKSAVWFAERVESVWCVDLWLEIPCAGVPYYVYELFLANVKRYGFENKIKHVRGDSQSEVIAGLLPDVFDLIYIDGSHTYEGCKRDIELYWPKVRRPGGVMCGDDYDPATPDLAGVPKAVDEVIPDRQTQERFWWKIFE